MSRIWAALPLPNPLDAPPSPAGICWWRTLLPKDHDGNHLVIRTDSHRDDVPPRLGCWEWFDGLDLQLIHGVDVFDVRFEYDRGRQYLDVLAPPIELFRLGKWANLTAPDQDDQRHPSGFGFGLSTPPQPFDYAPAIRDFGFPG